VTPTQVWWTAAAVLGGAALFAARSASAASIDVGPVTGDWRDYDAPRRIREIAAPIERLANWPGLGMFLSGVAYIESRGSPTAQFNQTSNAARGWFGIRPVSARVSDLGMSPDALKDEAAAVALAAWYAHRCQPYADRGQVIDWLAIRRCWGYPRDTDDVDSTGYRAQLARGLQRAGVSPDLMYYPAFPAGYHWPGIDAVLAAVGRARAA